MGAKMPGRHAVPVQKNRPTLLFGASANHQGESQRTSCPLEGIVPTQTGTPAMRKKFHAWVDEYGGQRANAYRLEVMDISRMPLN